MELTAVICSVGRPEQLATSLAALKKQVRVPDHVLVVAQRQDEATVEVARAHGADVALVDRPGAALAIETALRHASGEIAAFVDDDAIAHADWTERIEATFAANSRIGAVGGRDNVRGDRSSGGPHLVVGRLTRSGRLVGNHHLGAGGARRADTVKGANMAIRLAAGRGIPLGNLVVGVGAQYRWELVLTSIIARRGFTILYDPAIQVDHHPAERAAGDERRLFSRERVALNVQNEYVAMSALGRKAVARAWYVRLVLIGDRLHPGLATAAREAARGDRSAIARFRGVLDGLRASRRRRAEVDALISHSDRDFELG